MKKLTTTNYKVRWWISTISLALANLIILLSLQQDPVLIFGFITNFIVLSTLWTAQPFEDKKKVLGGK